MAKIILYIIIAVLPSIIWLLFYLRKDKHPESNKMVVKIFFWGILSALGALVFEFLHLKVLTILSLQNVTILIIGGAAFIEEYLKYLVVKIKVLKNSEFDEPIDAMLYLIIAALGFAAAENIFLLNGLYAIGTPINEVFGIALGRFLSAVFLHALSSGIIGYFLARSLCLKSASPARLAASLDARRAKRASRQNRKSFVSLGIIVATCLHGVYNYIIMGMGPVTETSIILLVVLLVSMAIGVSLAFKSLGKLKSICNI